MSKCRQCKKSFTPTRPLQRVCSMECAIVDTRAKRTEAQRKENRIRRERIKTTTELASEAQTAFNRYIRVRDSHRACISCGQPASLGQRHASHYRSRAAASQLRFNTYNVHASCAQCNSSKSGNIVEYRKALIHRIGQERVEWLENNHDKVKWDADYLRRLKRVFAKRARHTERLRAR